ncbi:MAG: hypothetical protein I8H75_06110 [Myxococcaceae bacterium]|nr:hypothetical protein [Myxococcaceae bacterium]MBH2006888.1 hypothetical protein [Myxococcaceae bacterium]
MKSQKAPMLQALKEDLQKLSQELKSGKISAEEASKQFVDLVIAKKNEFGLNAKDMKRVQSAVSEIVSQDPLFSIKLEKELKRI